MTTWEIAAGKKYRVRKTPMKRILVLTSSAVSSARTEPTMLAPPTITIVLRTAIRNTPSRWNRLYQLRVPKKVVTPP